MGGSGRVWNFMARTQPNPPSPKNRSNLAGWVGLGWVGLVLAGR